MEKIVIIVGAGATVAEALTRNPSKDKIPPLDATFFDLCERANLIGLAEVKNYMLRNYGYDIKGLNVTMEEVFNHIYSDAHSDVPPDGCLNAYWSLIKMYSNSIAKTTNALDGSSRAGIGQIIKQILGKCSDPSITIITFNQDLIIEKSIESLKSITKYSHVEWSIKDTYEINFKEIKRVKRNPRFTETHKPNSIRILKLHGSLNWIYNVRSGSDPKNSIRNPHGALYCANSTEIFTNLSHKNGKKRTQLIPLVIPPIFEKFSLYKNHLNPLWSKAEEKISEATRLIIFGYSFPDGDFASKSLLRRSFFRNSNLFTCDVIDINPIVLSKVSTILRLRHAKYWRSVKDFQL